MNIKITRDGEGPTPSRQIVEELASWDPAVFLLWNPSSHIEKDSKGREVHEGRWEIWVELDDNTHPNFRYIDAEGDRYNREHECWMRKLQTYEHEDGSFAPIDWRVVRGLRMADTWSRDDYYKEHVEEPHLQKERQAKERVAQAAKDAANYRKNWDNPIIGPHTSGDWRHRIRTTTKE